MLKKKFFWWGILLCLLIVLSWGLYLYNKPHRSAGEGRVALSIDADSLFRLYQGNEQAADQKYLDKVIEVKGKLVEIQHSAQTEIWILEGQPGGGGVNCQLFPEGKSTPGDPRPGETVTLRGRCTGFLMDVNLADCVVSK